MATKDRPLIVALDIGTSSTRALLYDSAGKLQPGRETKIEYRQSLTSDGGVECDPDHLVKLTLTAIHRLAKKCSSAEKKRIAAVAASCFWHALLGVDANGEAATPLYSWGDTRSSADAERLSAVLSPKAYHERTGAFFHSSYWPAKIQWLRRTQPEVAARVDKWLSFPDYLALRLCDDASTSISLASGSGLMNQESCDWDPETLKALSLDSKTLPGIERSKSSFRVSEKSSGLPSVPWFWAYGDGVCSNIGAGGVSESRVVVNISTSGAIRVLCERVEKPIPAGLFRYRLDERRSIVGGAVSNGGNVYAWLMRTLQMESGLDRRLLKAAPDAHGLTVLPYWAGERSPGWHAYAQATILGLNLSTTPFEIAQASLEAIAYTFRGLHQDLVSVFPSAKEVIVSGGAVERSRSMPKRLANVLDAPVRVSLDPEPSGRGAALAVAESLGALEDLTRAPDRLSRTIDPNRNAAEIYKKAHERYEMLYHKLIGKS